MYQYFDRNYHTFEIDEIFRLYYLLSHEEIKNDKLTEMMIDTLKIRMSEKEERERVTLKGMKFLVKGMLRNKDENKKID